MPEASFIVKLNLPELSLPTLESTAVDIGEELISAGFDVVEATPWARPSLESGTLNQPTESEQPFGTGLQGLGGF